MTSCFGVKKGQISQCVKITKKVWFLQHSKTGFFFHNFEFVIFTKGFPRLFRGIFMHCDTIVGLRLKINSVLLLMTKGQQRERPPPTRGLTQRPKGWCYLNVTILTAKVD